ncbi:phosphotransferase [Slackia sp.]|uniref:phosphotransferase n=1 Tax=Slackia sp. TaxID=2049041 RepID=UPI00399957DC
MLTKSEFKILSALHAEPLTSQREVTERSGVSLGTANKHLKSLRVQGLIDGYTVTERGLEALAPYKVENAIIMAAGLSSRFAPISYEKPKGLLKVHGDVLIERQIRQLQEAGITDITVVVGYKKEHFFYLEREYGVTIVVNEEYAARNNNSSLMKVRHKLGNTFVCSSDDYFTENPFEPYVYKAYYASVFVEGPTKEWCIHAGTGDRIESVTVGGCDSQIMLGHVYFDRAFSRTFVRILEAEYDLPVTAGKLWEEIYVDHIKELDMVVRPYEDGIIHEFDSLDELREFDPHFLSNVDSEVFDNIVAVLGCDKNDIHDVYPLKQGLTNLSCHFAIGNDEYVYRHPGVGTEYIIDREAELVAQSLAKDLGLDDTYIFEDPQRGWKISRFIPNARQLDPKDASQVKRAMEMARRLHESPMKTQRTFDFYDESVKYTKLLEELKGRVDIAGFEEMAKKAACLKAFIDADDARHCLTHNDFFCLNFLIDEQDKMYLIDWEYSGMSDYASDFGTFVVCCELTREEAEDALAYYFGRTPTFAERCHNFAHVAMAGWCWYVWSLFKEAQGECVGEWLYIYYRYAVDLLDDVLSWYERGEA